MPEIIITVRDKLPVNTGDIHYIVTDNSDYTVRFVFDDDWTEGEKTVYFVRSNGCVYKPQKTTDDMAVIPVQKDAGAMTQLLIGVQQGDIKTTRPCALNVYPSITDIITDETVQPDGTLWEDLMARIKALEEDEGVSQEEVEVAVKQYFADNPIDPADLGAVSADQGAENADKILGIGVDGKVIPVDKPQGNVKTVAGVKPDASGNVPLTASDVGAATKEQLNTLSGEVAKKQPAGNYATKEEIPAVPVKSVNGKTGAVKLTASDVGALPSSTDIPANTSDLNNNSGFITKAVSDLVNYYKKSETYTQAEVNALISAIPKFTISVVSTLPTTGISATTIYLVGGGSGSDLYTEYIYTGGKWEILGSQRVDLTGYAKETWVSDQISAYMTAENIAAALGYTPADSADLAAKANRSGWAVNKYLGTDAAGNMVTRDAPAGEGGGSGTPGADGFSPIAKVVQLADGAKITITDATGTTEASVYNGKDGADGEDGKDGTSVTVTNVTESTADGGENAITFSDGTIVKIRNGSKGSAGKDGESGSDGEDGVSVTSVVQTTTSEADGGINVITVTLSNGQKATFNIKNGSKGSAGKDGASGSDGEDGVSITSVEQTTTSDADGGTNVITVTLSNGQKATFNIKNGSKGSAGAPGADGKDYVLTEADKTAIASQAAAQIDVSGKLDKSGGTMTGKLVAQNNADYADKQVRNVFVIADGASLPTGANGDICLVYTP